MSTLEIANKLVELCRQGRNDEALATLFAADAVSVEAFAPPGMQQVAKGQQAIRAKGDWWRSNHEIHSASVTGPWSAWRSIYRRVSIRGHQQALRPDNENGRGRTLHR